MVHIQKSDLDNLRFLGSGGYGSVYQKDDSTAYKIYHATTTGPTGRCMNNPSLNLPRMKFHLLRARQENLHYTDVLSDLIYVDGKFGGICIPYYDGCTLKKMLNATYEVKRDISNQLIRNSKELTGNYIYPLDYKLNNIMLTNGVVKIIDLDDCFTHVWAFSNPLYQSGSISSLNDTIRNLFQEFDFPYSSRILHKLERNRGCYASAYEKIEEYLKRKDIPSNYLVINQYSDIGLLMDLLKVKKYRVIFQYDNLLLDEHAFLSIFNQFEKLGVSLFDFQYFEDRENYFHNFKVNECLEIQEKRIIKKR